MPSDSPSVARAPDRAVDPDTGPAPGITEQLAGWLEGVGPKTFGGLVDVFEEKSFALLFVLLLGVSALPIPTGGATHVFDVIAVLIAGQLVIGRDRVWVPDRWKGLALAGPRQQRFIRVLLKAMRWIERVSRPRLSALLDRRFSNAFFGMSVIVLTAAAFLAPPFSGLDTLPALGVVLIALGFMLEDALVIVVGLGIGVGGVAVEVLLGQAAVHSIGSLF